MPCDSTIKTNLGDAELIAAGASRLGWDAVVHGTTLIHGRVPAALGRGERLGGRARRAVEGVVMINELRAKVLPDGVLRVDASRVYGSEGDILAVLGSLACAAGGSEAAPKVEGHRHDHTHERGES